MIDKNGNVIKADIPELTRYGKQFTGLTEDKENLLLSIKDEFSPHLVNITENFYTSLEAVPEAKQFIEGKTDSLKQTHIKWMHNVFSGPYDDSYTEAMYKVGDVHVKVGLPVEFMSGGITLITNELNLAVFELHKDDMDNAIKIISAINSIMGFSLFVMQKSYHASVGEALDKFLHITGMSKALFEKLASTFNASHA